MNAPAPALAPERIVVVGYGPVAARLVEELEPGIRAGMLHVSVVGEEHHPAYNRVLVADVGVGRTPAEALTLADPEQLRSLGVDLYLGTKVRRIDRARRTVLLGKTGHPDTALPYDRLVLATGARPVIPNLIGLNPDPTAERGGAPVLPPGVTALRNLQDAAALQNAVAGRRSVVVLGGGILGLEVALAAAEEGARVTVVFSGPHPLGRSVDAIGGSVLAAQLRSRGVRLAPNARSTAVELSGPDTEGRPGFSALLLSDGAAIDGDLLVLSCGVRARTELAAGAGLPTDRGVLVDHRLAVHHDPRIFAIGDCAEIRCQDPRCNECLAARGPAGLIGPGWRQAEWLAEDLLATTGGAGAGAAAEVAGPVPGAFSLTGSLAPVTIGSPEAVTGPLPAEQEPVILLKARGIDLACAGSVAADPWDSELLEASQAPGRPGLHVSLWADPEHGRYVKMATRGGVLEGLLCLGMPRTAAELVLLFERRAELPADRSLLLRLDGPEQQVPGATAGAGDPGRTVCRCAGISRSAICAAAADGCSTVQEVSARTRAGTGCGGCHADIKELIETHFQPLPA